MPDKSGRGAIAGAILALAAATLAAAPASAQSGEPIKIGFSMALTGGSRPTASPRSWRKRSGKRTSTPKAGCSADR